MASQTSPTSTAAVVSVGGIGKGGDGAAASASASPARTVEVEGVVTPEGSTQQSNKSPSSCGSNSKKKAKVAVNYIQRVHDSLVHLCDRQGSSLPSILKCFKGKNPEIVPDMQTKRYIMQALKRGVDSGRFVKVKQKWKVKAGWAREQKKMEAKKASAAKMKKKKAEALKKAKIAEEAKKKAAEAEPITISEQAKKILGKKREEDKMKGVQTTKSKAVKDAKDKMKDSSKKDSSKKAVKGANDKIKEAKDKTSKATKGPTKMKDSSKKAVKGANDKIKQAKDKTSKATSRQQKTQTDAKSKAGSKVTPKSNFKAKSTNEKGPEKKKQTTLDGWKKSTHLHSKKKEPPTTTTSTKPTKPKKPSAQKLLEEQKRQAQLEEQKKRALSLQKKREMEKIRLEKIRQRKFPMEDLKLIQEDIELLIPRNNTFPRPQLPVGDACMEDILYIFHMCRGDVGAMAENSLPPGWSLGSFLDAVAFMRREGGLAPLVEYLMLAVFDQVLEPKDGLCGGLFEHLCGRTWMAVLYHYMNVMDDYYRQGQEDHVSSYLGPIDGKLRRAHVKLMQVEPDEMKVDDVLLLLRTLCDDLFDDISLTQEFTMRSDKLVEAKKVKRDADWAFKRAKLGHEAFLKVQIQEQEKKKQQQQLLSMLQASSAVHAHAADRDKELDTAASDVTDETSVSSLPLSISMPKSKEAPQDAAANVIALTKDDSSSTADAATATEVKKKKKKVVLMNKTEFEAAEKAKRKAFDEYYQLLRSAPLRAAPLGQDRDFASYFHFHTAPDTIFIRSSDKSEHNNNWQLINLKSTFDQFVASLDVRGIREHHLSEQVTDLRRLLYDDIKHNQKKDKMKKDLEEIKTRYDIVQMDSKKGRRSGRLKDHTTNELATLEADMAKLEDQLQQHEQERPPLQSQILNPPTSPTSQSGYAMIKSFESDAIVQFDRKKHLADVISEVISLEDALLKLQTMSSAATSPRRSEWRPSLGRLMQNGGMEDPFRRSPPQKKRRRSPVLQHQQQHVSMRDIVDYLKVPLLQIESQIYALSHLQTMHSTMLTPTSRCSPSLPMYKWKKELHYFEPESFISFDDTRDILISAISQARRHSTQDVVDQLREALRLVNVNKLPDAKLLIQEFVKKHGGFERSIDDSDDEDSDSDDEDDSTSSQNSSPNPSFSTLHGAELTHDCPLQSPTTHSPSSSRATRADWISALKSCQTLHHYTSLLLCLTEKTTKLIRSLTTRNTALRNALDYWKTEETNNSRSTRAKKNQKKPKKNSTKSSYDSRTLVWTPTIITNDIVWVSKSQVPYPARRCQVRDEDIQKDLEMCRREIIAFMGMEDKLYAVKAGEVMKEFDGCDVYKGKIKGRKDKVLLKDRKKAVAIAQMLYSQNSVQIHEEEEKKSC